MKLIPLPNGAFIDPHTVTAVTVDTNAILICGPIGPERSILIRCDSPEHAKERAAALAAQINRAVELTATVSPPEPQPLN